MMQSTLNGASVAVGNKVGNGVSVAVGVGVLVNSKVDVRVGVCVGKTSVEVQEESKKITIISTGNFFIFHLISYHFT